MALTRLSPNVAGTPLPNTPTTGNPFRYRGPKGPDDQEARELVARYQEIKGKMEQNPCNDLR